MRSPALLIIAALSLGGCNNLLDSLVPALSPHGRSLRTVDDYHEPDYVARTHPKHILLAPDGASLFVALEGDLVTAGSQVVEIDTNDGHLLSTYAVGSSPQGMAFGPRGLIYVANQFSDFVSVIDRVAHRVVGSIPVSFYAQKLAVSEDGKQLYLSNRWLDAVEVVRLDDSGLGGAVARTIPLGAGANPRDLVVGRGGLLYVGTLAATSIVLIDPVAGREVDRLYTNSPINGLCTDGRFVFVATLGRGDGHDKAGGVDAVHGNTAYRGDSTASTGFSDINNDLMVLDDQGDGHIRPVARYTSDTAEVSMRDAKGDYDVSELIVEGALPEQLTAQDGRLYVSMSASDQVQMLTVDPASGALAQAGIVDTGINPYQVAVLPGGATIFTADRLGETVSRIDAASGAHTAFALGTSGVAYPASEYELGELLFHSARFSSEALPSPIFPNGDKAGDKSCNHCHRETLTDGKVWTVGIGKVVPLGGERMPPAARNLRDTNPLFWEGVQHPEDFDLESNEFAPPEDFGCDRAATEATPEACAARDAFFQKQVGHSFREVAKHVLGVFLTGRPRLLPNPDAQAATGDRSVAIERGRTLFFSNEVRCSKCHPSSSDNPTHPFTINETIAAVITGTAFDSALVFKTRLPGTFNVPSLRGVFDRPSVFFHDGRAKSVRSAILSPGHPALTAGRDGCQNLALGVETFEAGVVRPLRDGSGCNEVGGAPDIHGTTSQLSPSDVDDLVAFVLSIE